MRSIDWSKTAVGPVSEWSQALRTTVGLLLRNRFPLILWWGPEFTQFYNDTYRPILGDKHPRSMGQPASECWSEIWHVIGPMIEAPFSGLPATASNDLFLLINRRGFVEETHFKVAYSPVPDDTVQPTGIGGVLATVAETTEQVYGERQLRTLRELGARAAEAKTPEKACQAAAETLLGNDFDVPFALFYLIEPGGEQARLVASCGFEETGPANPVLIELDDEMPWPLKSIVQRGEIKVISDLSRKFGPLPRGRWPDPPQSAIMLPFTTPDQPYAYGVLISGLNPHRELNDGYRTFFELAAGQVTTAIRNARAYQEERKRAEALAELDRAKTTFFSNVSHEFRTPLTLMLGPLEDLLRADLPPEERDEVSLIHRNSLRLLKLVNTLLDFSRIEAGRIQASYEATDLAAYTAELASVFRSAMEKGGLSLNVDCPALPEPVYVDREMWEKIVLNLLSNAFKFTFEGEISVSLLWCGDHVDLVVKDTGTGIDPEEMPRLFERFHRIKGARSRSYEGTGIGLALVLELVKLHGGGIKAESISGKGTTFTVTVPTGRAHLPSDRIGAARTLSSTSTGAASYVEEALKWLPDGISSDSDLAEDYQAYAPADGSRSRVLLADDNADMRGYIHRLLSEHYEVEAVADGGAALNAALRDPPDLVLTDIMMPVMDGIGLLKALREDFRTQSIPVIFLSARAGEEAKAEGMEAGADDYLVKPFSARELMARVAAHIQMARIRREAALKERELRRELEKELDERKRAEKALRESEAKLKSMAENVPCVLMRFDRQLRVVYLSKQSDRYNPNPVEQMIGRTNREMGMPEHLCDLWDAAIERVFGTGNQEELEFEMAGPSGMRTFALTFAPEFGPDHEVRYVLGVSLDITERKKDEEALKQSEERFYKVFSANPNAISISRFADGYIVDVNEAYLHLFEFSREDVIGRKSSELGIFNFTNESERRVWLDDIAKGKMRNYEMHYRTKTGRPLQVLLTTDIITIGNIDYIIATIDDITQRKQAEEALRQSEECFHRAFHSNPAALTITRASDNLYVDVNESFSHLLEYSREEVVGHSTKELNLFPNYAEREEAVALTLEHGYVRNREMDVRTRTGKILRVLFSLETVNINQEKHILATFIDITERKQIENALKVSEGRYKLLFENANDGIVLHRVTSEGIPCDIMQTNEVICRMLGYTKEEMIRLKPMDIQIECLEEVDEELQKILSHEKDILFERHLIAKDGRIIPVEFHTSVLDLQGSTAAISIIRDITERKQAEEERQRLAQELADRIAELQAVLNSAPVAVWIAHDPQCLKITGNVYADQILQAPQGGNVSRSALPGEAAIFYRVFREGVELKPEEMPAQVATATGMPIIGDELELVFPDGRSVYLMESAVPLFDAAGRVRGAIIAGADVTRIKLAERALQESKERLAIELADTRLLQGISSELIEQDQIENLYERITDAAVTIMRSDFASLQMLYPERGNGGELHLLAFRGFTPQAAKFWEWVSTDSESTCGIALHTGKRVMAQDIESCDFIAGSEDLATYRQTGIRAVQTTPLLSRTGKLVGMISTHWSNPYEPSERDLRLLDILARQAADLLEYKQAEEELRRSRDELEQRVAERTADLTKANVELTKAKEAAEAAVEAKAAFLANMSHELRTPMNAVIGFSSLLLDDSLTPDQQDYMERIRIGGESLLAIINDILDFSKMEKKKVELEHQPLSLRSLVEGSLSMVAVHAGDKGLNLSVTISYGTPDTLIGDPGRLRQILINLLSNAVKFTDVGEVSVSVSSKALEDNRHQILFAVRDTGIGIPKDKMDQLFLPFSQVEASISSQRGGTGLGLAISKRLVELMGGRIWADSTPGKGSTFSFTIEAEAAPDEIADSRIPENAAYENLAEKNPLRILVAEDVPSNQKVLVEMLRRMGYRADMAADGREVLQALKLLPYDLILMDIQMPEMDGIAAAREIRKLWPNKGPKIIAITAYALDGDREKCLKAGMDDYIAKPVQKEELALVLKRWARKGL
jgi:PAS domain S-box-containing protein